MWNLREEVSGDCKIKILGYSKCNMGERVVMVDNDLSLIELQREIFQRSGLELTPILSGEITLEEILARIKELNPDIVLTGVKNRDDAAIFDESGIDLAAILSSQGRRVMIYSYDPSYKRKADRLGIPFACKMNGPLDVIEKIKELLETSE